MAELIIGHTTHESVRIWVRASAETRNRLGRPVRVRARIRILPRGAAAALERRRELAADNDFTGVIEVRGLRADVEHHCELGFSSAARGGSGDRVVPEHARGRFRTFPRSGARLDFLLGSCNTRHKHSDSSFSRIAEIARSEAAAFMIHCGDQIYYPRNTDPTVSRYRRQYRETWRRGPVRSLLTQLPHYMILDDHEIRNNFRNDRRPAPGRTARFDMRTFRRRALRAYREYQNSRNPRPYQGKLYYDFSFGDVRFFVLDVRTERWQTRGQMIGPGQMARLFEWLRRFPDDIKFVVTAVPFLVEVEQETSRSPGRDKWCAAAYVEQRNEILEFLCEEPGLRPPVFLTGDMHNSYHATTVLRRGSRTVKLHELMSSPINQKVTSLGKRDRYILNGDFPGPGGWTRRIRFPRTGGREQYFSEPNIMHIQVEDPRVRFRIYPTREGAGRAAVIRAGFPV